MRSYPCCKLFGILVLFLISTRVLAEWTPLTLGKDFILYVDKGTIRKADNRVKMWSLLDYKSETVVGGYKLLSIKMFSEYDCKEEQLKWDSATYFSDQMGAGDVVNSVTAPPYSWVPVEPGSMGESEWNLACGKQ
ncbi:MAG TPA: surface-adhesin E family protein [Methylophilaceae bacterium]